jgi:hypothetical protein
VLKASDHVRISQYVRVNHFHRDDGARPRIERPVRDTQRPGPERRLKLVRPD